AVSPPARCAGEHPTYRFVTELRVSVRWSGEGSRSASNDTASALLVATRDHLCLEALELRLPESEDVLVATFGAPAHAVVRRRAAPAVAAACALEAGAN